jgi:hypothetical protein
LSANGRIVPRDKLGERKRQTKKTKQLFFKKSAFSFRSEGKTWRKKAVRGGLEKAQGVQEKSTFVAHQKLPLLVA